MMKNNYAKKKKQKVGEESENHYKSSPSATQISRCLVRRIIMTWGQQEISLLF